MPNQAEEPTAPRRVLLMSSNGTGLGHVTRLMAIARRLPESVEAVITTLSLGAPLVEQEGFLTEYIASRAHVAMPVRRWNAYLRARLDDLIAEHRPDLVGFDGVHPYLGLLSAIQEHPDITWTWIRRPMWQPGKGEGWITRGRAFDRILEPGELAADADAGATVPDRHRAHRVGPITYLDPAELLDPTPARQELGLDDRPAALVQMGAGNIMNIGSPVARIAQHLTDFGFQVVVGHSPIATSRPAVPEGVRAVSVYPIGRYLRAFDLAVSAAGYNMFHELIGACIPTVFAPILDSRLDDQLARARYASSAGAALLVENAWESDLESILDRATLANVRARLAARCAELAFSNGAVEGARWLAALATDTESRRG